MIGAAAVVLGALISGMVGVLVVIVQQRLAGRHELEMAKAHRLGELSAAGWATTLALGDLARAPLAEKVEVEQSERFQSLMDRFNSALAQIQLLDDGDVYAAAHAVDECLVHLLYEARAGVADRPSWRAKRADLGKAVATYQRAARAALGSAALREPEPWLTRANDPTAPST